MWLRGSETFTRKVNIEMYASQPLYTTQLRLDSYGKFMLQVYRPFPPLNILSLHKNHKRTFIKLTLLEPYLEPFTTTEEQFKEIDCTNFRLLLEGYSLCVLVTTKKQVSFMKSLFSEDSVFWSKIRCHPVCPDGWKLKKHICSSHEWL